ncbi:DUF6207 family protein [Streptomyces chumphonensis]|uniref:DUF6207 family protein n=1 Tax=Streptomyces chumphonensis TaxID=1214925 RepID=UPI0036306E0A
MAFQPLLADRWATTRADHTTRNAGDPGVRVGCYLDLKQPVGSDASAHVPPQIMEVQL